VSLVARSPCALTTAQLEGPQQASVNQFHEQDDERFGEEVYAAYLAMLPKPAGAWSVHVPYEPEEVEEEGSPLSYLGPATRSNLTVVFLTGFAGTDQMLAFAPPRPSFTPGSHAFAFTTRSTEAATGFATRAVAANWTVVYMEETFIFPEKPEWMKWNLLMKQVRNFGRPTHGPDTRAGVPNNKLTAICLLNACNPLPVPYLSTIVAAKSTTHDVCIGRGPAPRHYCVVRQQV
jgi:hypothetical protein